MSHRERVQNALNHEETDIVWQSTSGAARHPRSTLRPTPTCWPHLGFLKENLPASHRGKGQVIAPSEKFLQHFDVDVRGFYTSEPDLSIGKPNSANRYRDERGVEWEKSDVQHPYDLSPLNESS
jgi:hypothetical protein